MTQGYRASFADVTDPEGYKAYVAANSKAFVKFGACYRSPECAEAMVPRKGKAVIDLAIVRGYDVPQATAPS